MDKPKAYVKTKYYNYFKNNKKSNLPDKLHSNILSPEYKQYLKLQDYLKTHKKIKKEVKNEILYKIFQYRLNLAKNNLYIINKKYNNQYKLHQRGLYIYIIKK